MKRVNFSIATNFVLLGIFLAMAGIWGYNTIFTEIAATPTNENSGLWTVKYEKSQDGQEQMAQQEEVPPQNDSTVNSDDSEMQSETQVGMAESGQKAVSVNADFDDKQQADPKKGTIEVSSELFDAIMRWQDESPRTYSLEEFTVIEHPDIFNKWVGTVQEVVGHDAIFSYFADTNPEASRNARQELGKDADDPVAFLYYMILTDEASVMTWQISELSKRQITLLDYVSKENSEVIEGLNQANEEQSDDKLTSFVEFMRNEEPEVARQAKLLIARFDEKRGGDECVCSVVSTFQALPSTQESDSYLYERHKKKGRLKERIAFNEAAEGAAHSGDLHRYIYHGLNAADYSRVNYTRLRVTILCLGDNGDHCDSGTCNGQVHLQSEYGSNVFVRTETKGIWSRGSVALAGDAATLTYDPPGAMPAMTLFNKGLVVEREEKLSWNEDAFVDLVEATVGIAATTSGDISSLDTDLVSTAVRSLLGLVTHSGDGSGVVDKTFYANYDTATTSPLTIESGNTYVVSLDSTGVVFGRGYGGQSTSEAKYNSSYWFVMAANNFTCENGVTPPEPSGFWSYADEGGPHSETTLVDNVNSFLLTELGFNGQVGKREGFFGIFLEEPEPVPIPPTARCTATPSFGVGSVNATLNASASNDPDGSIVNYNWNFGDGTSGSGVTTSHLFPGSASNDMFYNVQVTVTDNDGLTNTAYCPVEVMCEGEGGFACMH